ncbi:unnamed protein product [Heterotrigona itama]|uniref:Uncharacterized protein n=1 Tax=Heterotrigona itama TaxID=395501 RepID=A0A6V7H6Y8_9HYME|nr:unnamed protein product [Heterotrigona itama]
MTSEDDAWAQTVITVTPQYDATLREISDTVTVSSTPDVNLVLDPDDIVHRRSFIHRQFVESKETGDEEAKSAEKPIDEIERKSKEDAESQTYLQGIPVVRISIEYRDEASQTMYMSTPCPPLKYFRDIMTSMKDGPMPELKRSNVTTTIISFHPDTPQNVVMEQLSVDTTDKEREEFQSKLDTEMEETEMEVTEILHFLLARVFWIDDPTSRVQPETSDKATQTCIKYNNRTNIFVIDSQVQTDLSCEPKQSNTMLLTDYWQTKNMILRYLEDCISTAVDVRIIINDIIDEIVNKCAEIIRYPMKEQMVQTVATYKVDQEREEDVLRKLKLDIIVDPLEASIIVIPLMDNLLEMTCDIVQKNAVEIVKVILDGIIRRVMTIIAKLVQLEKQAQERKPIDRLLAKRKKRILELMSKKETETTSTQTSIAAISEVKKIKKSKQVLCSVCRRQSMCQWCLNDQELKNIPQEEIKILRTQDILLAYKPCYIVTKVTERDENLQLPCLSQIKLKPLAQSSLKEDPVAESRHTICVFLQPDKKIKPQGINVTKYFAQNQTMSSSSQTITTLLDQPICPASSSYHSTLTSQAANALQILKNTFCTRENCIISSQQTMKNCSFGKNEVYTKSTCSLCLSTNNTSNKINEQKISCIQQTCKTFSKLHLPTNISSNCTSSRIPMKSDGDGFKIIPIYLSQDTCT